MLRIPNSSLNKATLHEKAPNIWFTVIHLIFYVISYFTLQSHSNLQKRKDATLTQFWDDQVAV